MNLLFEYVRQKMHQSKAKSERIHRISKAQLYAREKIILDIDPLKFAKRKNDFIPKVPSALTHLKSLSMFNNFKIILKLFAFVSKLTTIFCI